MRDYIPDILFGKRNHCTYCGEREECRDHVIPISSYRHRRAPIDNPHGIQTFCCNRCNSILGSKVFPTFQARIIFVLGELNRKYGNLRVSKRWSDKEVLTLRGELRERVAHLQDKIDKSDKHHTWIRSEEFRKILKQFSKLDLIDPSSPNYLEWLDAYFQYDLTSILELAHQGA